MLMNYQIFSLPLVVVLLSVCPTSSADDITHDDAQQLPNAKPIPKVQLLPLPYGQASFTYKGRELTRYHYGPAVQRPFWYPINGPEGVSYTRMGHPHDPHGHRHHDSVWITHMKVDASTEGSPQGGESFWEHDTGNRIVCQRVQKLTDSDESASMVTLNHWMIGDRLAMREMRRCIVRPIDDEQWMMIVDIELKAPGDKPIVLGQTPFGLFAVRLSKMICVHDGGGRILNSEGKLNEKPIFHQPARWVDYSGRVTNETTGGITLMNHPDNPASPATYHVRNDGWMGASTTGKGPMTLEPGKVYRFRYGLWVHPGVPNAKQADAVWTQFKDYPREPIHWK